ncbi:MAG: GNAT family N-acetyltransferase [Oscillospiraceae bacterium]|jgi:GNAT superfamily N-acetyltransferase|nr:GNAT family N-acetyltransferase [Oscillospiraceae bacterium]
MADMLVKLYADLPHIDTDAYRRESGVYIKRALIPDKEKILSFIRANFSGTWVHECEYALFHDPISCYIAVEDKEVIGFACYDATAKGFFGPFGVKESKRNKGIGRVLFHKCLQSMKEAGYGYAIIGWTSEKAIPFYQREAGATIIDDSPTSKSVYRNLIETE